MSKPIKLNFKIEEDVDLNIVELNFNKYNVEDGTILRVLDIPTKVLRLTECDAKGYPQYVFQGRYTVSALVPVKLRGKPSKEPFDQKKDATEQLDFISIIEPWNTFELADGTRLRTRLIIYDVFRSEKKNYLGEPIYVVKGNTSVNTKIPESLKKK